MTSWVLMALDRLLALRVSEALQPRSLASQAVPPQHTQQHNTTAVHESRARRHLAAGSLGSYSCFQRAPALHAPTHNTIHTVNVVGYCQKLGDGTDGRNHIINYSIIP